ncbi:hypothetical protein D3C72_1627690 [compost metagenome]
MVHALVVFGALGRVGQDFIGLGDALEARLGAGGLVAVGVEAHGQRTVNLLDFIVAGIGRDTEDVI